MKKQVLVSVDRAETRVALMEGSGAPAASKNGSAKGAARKRGAQAGYRVAFVPFKNGKPAGGYETFADGFWKEDAAGPKHRPVGVAVGPDGSLYITDDAGGTIWRVMYRGR